MTMRTNEAFFDTNREPSWVQRRVPYGYTAEFPNSSGEYPPTIEFRVPMCCSKCEDRVIEGLCELKNVYKIFCDQLSGRVTVTGHVDPFQALKRLKRIKRKSEFWDWGATSINSNHERSFPQNYTPRFETVYRSSPNEVSFYGEPSRTDSYEPSYRNSYDSCVDGFSYNRLTSPLFSFPRSRSYRYERVPPFEQTYHAEDYPFSTYY